MIFSIFLMFRSIYDKALNRGAQLKQIPILYEISNKRGEQSDQTAVLHEPPARPAGVRRVAEQRGPERAGEQPDGGFEPTKEDQKVLVEVYNGLCRSEIFWNTFNTRNSIKL